MPGLQDRLLRNLGVSVTVVLLGGFAGETRGEGPQHGGHAAGILLTLYERNPDHPGPMHYLTHANDVSGRERESLEFTRKP